MDDCCHQISVVSSLATVTAGQRRAELVATGRGGAELVSMTAGRGGAKKRQIQVGVCTSTGLILLRETGVDVDDVLFAGRYLWKFLCQLLQQFSYLREDGKIHDYAVFVYVCVPNFTLFVIYTLR